MIESMTGFGRGRAQGEGVAATVEMRSVNSRYCEVVVRLPRVVADREAEIQALVKQRLERGRINVQVHLEAAVEDVLPLRVDPAAAEAYARLLESLRRAAGVADPVRLEHLLTFSDTLFTTEETPEVGEQTWEVIQEALDASMESLRAMRLQEGQALHDDLAARIDALEAHVNAVEVRAPERLAEARERLRERLKELIGDEHLDPDRLELEIVLFADKLDVTEECVRLRSHLHLFREALASDEAVGRKLNFLVQEINREVNTIGSKSNDADMAHRAVEMKEELEKIREQVQNIA